MAGGQWGPEWLLRPQCGSSLHPRSMSVSGPDSGLASSRLSGHSSLLQGPSDLVRVQHRWGRREIFTVVSQNG